MPLNKNGREVQTRLRKSEVKFKRARSKGALERPRKKNIENGDVAREMRKCAVLVCVFANKHRVCAFHECGGVKGEERADGWGMKGL